MTIQFMLGFPAAAESTTEAASRNDDLRVMSLNLHGYHPTGAPERWMENRAGQKRLADSNLFFFSRDELDSGHRRRLDRLASDLMKLKPSIILLQEVAASGPGMPKTCTEFFAQPPGDPAHLNAAVRLLRRLKTRGEDYELSTVCRGNLGWWTEPSTFATKRILRKTNSNTFEVVHDFDSNPYPDGIVVEGLAILVRKSWRILDEQRWTLDIPGAPDSKSIIQAITIGKADQWFVAVNVHAGRRFQHFEQAVALRERLAEYLRDARFQGQYAGLVIGGDFNAGLYRPNQVVEKGEISTVPWEVSVPGEYSLLSPPFREQIPALRTQLVALARETPPAPPNDGFEEEVNRPVLPIAEAEARATHALERLGRLLDSPAPVRHSWTLAESLHKANVSRKCQPESGIDSACSFSQRIDHLFAEPWLRLSNAFILFPRNNWTSLDSVSDHPGVFASFLTN
ncbi:MAG TPA: hypothetical protein VJB59_05780 [Bdellovibrionota bacterium]|nr:hypothetical protein [Bdellovibrionota bacterium]